MKTTKLLKKIFVLGLVTAATLMFTASVSAAATKIDTANAKNGYVTVTYDGGLEKTIAVKVEHVSSKAVDVFYITTNKPENVPLSRGDGEYVISVLQNVSGNSYMKITSETVNAKIEDQNARFLVPNTFTVYDKDMEFLKGYNTTLEKIQAVNEKLAKFYEDVITKVVYDDAKKDQLIAANKTTNYVPWIDTTYKVKKGICSDYATLVAGYLRSLGIPTKVVMGYNPEIGGGAEFHAWNEILIDGKWLTVDATWDAAYVQAGYGYEMAKDWKDLTISKVY